MGWRYSISLTDKGAANVLAAMSERARDLRPAMDDIGRMLMASTDLRFERAVDPDGNPWTPLAASTVKRKAKAGRERMLQWSGRLRRDITRAATSNSVTIGTITPYARAQQEGADINHYAHSREVLRSFVESGGRKELRPGFVKRSKANFASWHEVGDHTVHLPARPFLGINAEDETEARRILRAYLLRGSK